MFSLSVTISPIVVVLLAVAPALAQQTDVSPEKPRIITQQTIDDLIARLAAHEARIKELEEKLAQQNGTSAQKPMSMVSPAQPPAAVAAAPAPAPPATADLMPPDDLDEHAHMMDLPGGGPTLKLRGFMDFNLGFGSDANPLIFPLNAPAHNTFQNGEFDLFVSSRLSDTLSFFSEVIIGSDPTNAWGLDIERLQLTYRPSQYFEISGGRYHTAIGYYNTAFHHGTWFQTATGRPFMYFFEDSGGILPVHSVGVSTSGLVPGTGKLGLHWVAEIGNGRSSSFTAAPVQNFLSDKNRKDFNLAAYIKPQWVPGLQVGGSFYRDRMVPAGIPHVNQNIASLYAVYMNSDWEFLNEGVWLSNKLDGQDKSYNTPLVYTQVSRKFGRYRPFVRYQYVNVPSADPINIFTGRYDGPSAGLRMDYTNYAALKIQYNRLYQRVVAPANGLDLQVAFTF